MSDALDVSAAILERRKPGQQIDQMKLHKLVYFVQAGSLAWFDTPAFPERIEAWKWGPMTRRVAGHYKGFGREPIPAPSVGSGARLDQRTAWLVERVIEEYGDLSGPRLSELTKEPGTPWRQVRGDLPDSADSDREIPTSLIAEFHRRHGVFPSTPTEFETQLAQRFFDKGDPDALADLFEAVTGARPNVG